MVSAAQNGWSELSPWTRWRRVMWQCVRPAWEFVFPPACLVCGTDLVGEANVCPPCLAELTPADVARCLRCAAPCGPHLETASGCVRCRDERFAVRRVLAWGVYEGRLQQLIIRTKDPYGRALALMLADRLLDDRLAELWTERFDAVVPVPHDWRRRMWQVHTPSETIAERLARRLDRRYAPQWLIKPRPTPRQSTAAPADRRQQQRGAFAVPPMLDLTGARILLVDDVLTTGATAHAAASALKAAGASDVIVAVLARGLGQASRK